MSFTTDNAFFLKYLWVFQVAWLFKIFKLYWDVIDKYNINCVILLIDMYTLWKDSHWID